MPNPPDYVSFLAGGGLTAFDWTTMVALFVVSIVYFLAPVLGYSSSGRGPLFMSMWMLVAKFGLALLKFAFLFRDVIEGGSSVGAGRSTSSNDAMLMGFFLMESGLFVVAMVLFVCGLATLRRPFPMVEPRLPVVEPRRRDYQDD
jgi:hypothetical protein